MLESAIIRITTDSQLMPTVDGNKKRIRKYPMYRALRMDKFFFKKSIYADFCADSYSDVRVESVGQSVFFVLNLIMFFLGIKILLVGSAIVRLWV